MCINLSLIIPILGVLTCAANAQHHQFGGLRSNYRLFQTSKVDLFHDSTEDKAVSLLRGKKQKEEKVKKNQSEECTIVVAQLLAIEPGTIEDQVFGE